MLNPLCPPTVRAVMVTAVLTALAACAQLPSDASGSTNSVRESGAKVPESVRQELAADLVVLQDQIRIKRISSPLPGPLSQYREFATSTRGGAITSSPSDRSQIVTTVYPGAIMGLSGKKVGEYVEVGYEYYGRLLTGWVEPDRVGLASGFDQTALTSEEKQALYTRILDNVNALRAKWSNNPYLSIDGFAINVDQTPSVNIVINYK